MVIFLRGEGGNHMIVLFPVTHLISSFDTNPTCMRYLIILTVLCTVFSCSPKSESAETSVDSTVVADAGPETATATAPTENEIPDSLYSKVDESLTGVDTVYNVLARQRVLIGSFESAQIVTEKLLQPSRLSDPRKLTAILIKTFAEGQYNNTFNTLAVYDPEKNEIVSYLDIGVDTEYQLNFGSSTAEVLELVTGQEAVLIRSISGEAGAGDHQTKREDVQIYAFVGEEVALIFSYTPSDYSYAGDEQGSSSETTITMDFSLGEINATRMPEITIVNSTDRTVTEDGETDNQPAMEPESTLVYTFTGKAYVQTSSY